MIPDRFLLARSDPEWRKKMEEDYGITVKVRFLVRGDGNTGSLYYDEVNDRTGRYDQYNYFSGPYNNFNERHEYDPYIPNPYNYGNRLY